MKARGILDPPVEPDDDGRICSGCFVTTIKSRRSAMGPFPHDAPAAVISADNPMGTDGFEFVEYAHPDPQALHALFGLMGYAPVARHRTTYVPVYLRRGINYFAREKPGQPP